MNADHWCAGAYIINKAVLKPFIDEMFVKLANGWTGVSVTAGKILMFSWNVPKLNIRFCRMYLNLKLCRYRTNFLRIIINLNSTHLLSHLLP